ncbi:hypothetical protein F7734_49470 [Scytonema sp. UIC 10036]|uniref:hypothetical protein n=1 Tax=Scytonema sp. UIC 10036 TaxID=2304196 RepID=UPI0012DA091B|nr:hypothetical protein [Scytonema sp. UIC 10036]MUG99882.1 hypothetical protein [Scytonema sp. UIC 10036]
MSQVTLLSLLFDVLTFHSSNSHWQSILIWLHTISDVTNGLGYYAIAIILIYFVSIQQQIKRYQRSEETLKEINNQLKTTVTNQALKMVVL